LPKPVLTGEMDGIRETLPEELKDKFAPVAVELKKGESSFHHARTMHGSRANDTPAPRRATVINVFRDGVMSDTNEPLLAGVPVIPRGDKMGGQFFPLLFDANEIREKVAPPDEVEINSAAMRIWKEFLAAPQFAKKDGD
jgi:ectoine hydroxylase-related dioxygenase (phytanoyl-CoA dioxygenase family)